MTQRVPMNRNRPPAHTSGSRCARHSSFVLAARHAAHANPAHAVRPSGSPIPQNTILTKGETILVRLVHCSAGGPPASRLDSACETFRLSTHSGLGRIVKSVVSPFSARNDMGCV